jgi:hypothetical protein
MLFNTSDFVAFLAVTALVHGVLPVRLRSWWLLVASFAFYFTWSVVHAAVLVGATLVAHLSVRRVFDASDERTKLAATIAGVTLLVLSLAAFKYGRALSGGVLRLAAPVGISYYTFKLVSYVVDACWGKLGEPRSFFDVARYAAFFPQILSGPIQRPRDFFEGEQKPLEASLVVSGLRLMLFGYFKKLVVADRAALMVDQVYAHPHKHPTEILWLTAYLFSIQLYADFSGFTDIAIGAGRLFGVRSPKNFDSPYYAANVQEFWRRWHMSLTTWLGDYVFTPLRMALRERGTLGLVVSITINMLAIGIWHGPKLTFVLFGLVNAVYVCVSALTLQRRSKWFKKHPALARARAIGGPLVVFHLMTIAFIAFRAESVPDAIFVTKEFVRGFVVGPAHVLAFARGTAWATLEGWSTRHVLMLAFGVGVMELVHVLQTRGRVTQLLEARPRWQRWAVYYALIAAIALLSMQKSQSFIYYKF